MRRRTFLKMGSLAAIAPFNIGAVMRPAAGRKIRLAILGAGSRGRDLVANFCTEDVVAFCDPDPNYHVKMRERLARFYSREYAAKVAAFRTYDELLEKMGDSIDAVIVTLPNHHHARAGLMAMARGVHVYMEKPMALTIEEMRVLRDSARRNHVVTQVGTQCQSAEGTRRLVEYIQAGAIGQVREVWSFSDRLNAMFSRPPAAPPPKGMDWDAWCGPAPATDYYAPDENLIGNRLGMHPHDWHDWIGYGNGVLGNIGTHIVNPAYWALRLGEARPASVEAKVAKWGASGSFPWQSVVEWKYPARKGLDPVTIHWYDGIKDGVRADKDHLGRYGECLKREYQNLPPIVEELEKKYGQNLGALGSILVGEKGIMSIGLHGGALQFVPNKLQQAVGKVPKTLPRHKGVDHQKEFLRAIREPDVPANCNFDYAEPFAEMIELANLAARTGLKRLDWDGTHFTSDKSANALLKTTYRKGWELPS